MHQIKLPQQCFVLCMGSPFGSDNSHQYICRFFSFNKSLVDLFMHQEPNGLPILCFHTLALTCTALGTLSPNNEVLPQCHWLIFIFCNTSFSKFMPYDVVSFWLEAFLVGGHYLEVSVEYYFILSKALPDVNPLFLSFWCSGDLVFFSHYPFVQELSTIFTKTDTCLF